MHAEPRGDVNGGQTRGVAQEGCGPAAWSGGEGRCEDLMALTKGCRMRVTNGQRSGHRGPSQDARGATMLTAYV
jgi:hypothetical protein